MRFLKLHGRKEVHVWTPLLAARGDMIEVNSDGTLYGSEVLGLILPVETANEEEKLLEPTIELVEPKEKKTIVRHAPKPKKPTGKAKGRPKKVIK